MYMFMPSKGEGEMKINTQEVEASIPELEPLRSDEDTKEVMEALGYDALNDRSPEDMHERKQQMGSEALYRQFRAAGKRGELFVLRGGDDRPIGLLGLRADTENNVGRITLLRSATREKAQFGITEKLLQAAEAYLRKAPRGYTRGIIESGNPSGHLEAAARHGHNANFWEFEEPEAEAANDNEAPPTVLENGQ